MQFTKISKKKQEASFKRQEWTHHDLIQGRR